MQRHNRGLTTIYNWFHDPGCDYPDLLQLREMHKGLDRAVLGAYGWIDIPTACEFIPEFDEANEDEHSSGRRRRYRYRWTDEIRDEVLARLLDLNRQRALEEGQLPIERPVFARPVGPEQKARSRKA